ncbi:hydroxyacylglutathione hydrolase [Actibacterium pelagium]|uniref:Hydroxyacylglutathione hydrolase n=1 Tax=Actibacterium pelagium TaxID=2029103 RepID=A0A917AL52_9RHOB|nr:hydroxyacylglutathione hydrolase [Actibacterium pelagium]GGE59432.1 hydroxyacylglutathione hydrolase [Actibacterium pelagium]
MPLELVTVPCLEDNYSFLVHDSASGATVVVDVPEAAPILAALNERGWTLTDIWLTHHHWDHIDGVAEVVEATGAKVTGGAPDAHRLPPLDAQVEDGDTFEFAGNPVQVFDVSGHTVGHIAFYLPAAQAAFTGDSLMALGCGRLFEGTPQQMWVSLSKLAALPGDTLICSGHEYTTSNAKFALTVEPENAKLISRSQRIDEMRAKGQATVPSLLSDELATNPFLRANLASVKQAIGMENAADDAVFAEIRTRKDNF